MCKYLWWGNFPPDPKRVFIFTSKISRFFSHLHTNIFILYKIHENWTVTLELQPVILMWKSMENIYAASSLLESYNSRIKVYNILQNVIKTISSRLPIRTVIGPTHLNNLFNWADHMPHFWARPDPDFTAATRKEKNVSLLYTSEVFCYFGDFWGTIFGKSKMPITVQSLRPSPSPIFPVRVFSLMEDFFLLTFICMIGT